MTLLPNASVHSLIHSSLGNTGPLHKLQALEGPRTFQSKLWPLDQDGSWSLPNFLKLTRKPSLIE